MDKIGKELKIEDPSGWGRVTKDSLLRRGCTFLAVRYKGTYCN
jgi:hypothetical protein